MISMQVGGIILIQKRYGCTRYDVYYESSKRQRYRGTRLNGIQVIDCSHGFWRWNGLASLGPREREVASCIFVREVAY